ncbi:MAG: type II and III secretion system protein family protein [Sphingomonadales bacterium]
MRSTSFLHRTVAATTMIVMMAGMPAAANAAPKGRKAPAAKVRAAKARVAQLPVGTQRPTNEVVLSVGQGQLVTLPTGVANVWTSNPQVADVYVSNPRQIHMFGKDAGDATIFATAASGQVVYATNVRVAQNITSIDRVLKLAMPDADIRVVTVGQVAVLTGTVATPDDAAQAEQLVKASLNPGVDVSQPTAQLKFTTVSRLKTATPLQVNLKVQIAEVSRSLSKQIGVNMVTRDQTNGLNVGIIQGRDIGTIGTQDLSGFPKLDASALYGLPAGSLSLPFNPATGQFITRGGSTLDFKGLGAGKTTLGILGSLFGVDVGAAIDLAETNGLVTMLAEPNLTALSGETASFLAGGEFPIPISQERGTISIEYKSYGVSLAFTPTVLSDGRISMRVRPEVSQLASEGTVTLNGFSIPGLQTRRTETTVELGSGQSFMIGGLLQNTNFNSIDKTPGLGDVPVLGAMFRSTGYRRNQTELVIIVTPYLVKPVSANEIKLPTDGLQTPTDLQNFLLGKDFSGRNGAERAKPKLAPPTTVPAPAVGAAIVPQQSRPAKRTAQAGAAPGFSN